MNRLDAVIETLATQFCAGFPAATPVLRTVGREAEFPVVTASGAAADVRRLWDALLAEGDLHEHYDSGTPNLIVGLDGAAYSYALEVGVGTVEVVTRPCASLFEIESLMQEAVGRLVRAAGRWGWQVLGYGVQPVTRPSLPLMAPKQRYHSLYRAMGAEWLWYTVTASDQCHVAVGQPELVEMLNFGNLMAPVIIALCANSPVYNGRLSPFCSGREGQMALIDAHEYRHGMPARPYTSIADYIRTVSEATYLIVRTNNEVIPSSQPFSEYLNEHGPDFTAFLFHEHYIWNSARLRTVHGTIEIRPACQQPWSERMAAMALTVGLIEAMPAINAYVQEVLGREYWSDLRTYHQQAIRYGLAAPQPAPDFLSTVVEHAEAGLQGRGQGEECFLQPIRDRLYRSQNPAQRARSIFQIDGLRGLLTHTAIQPAATGVMINARH
jgi:gamma-glutamylcysteine synthetase